jgi:hypothetical protein
MVGRGSSAVTRSSSSSVLLGVLEHELVGQLGHPDMTEETHHVRRLALVHFEGLVRLAGLPQLLHESSPAGRHSRLMRGVMGRIGSFAFPATASEVRGFLVDALRGRGRRGGGDRFRAAGRGAAALPTHSSGGRCRGVRGRGRRGVRGERLLALLPGGAGRHVDVLSSDSFELLALRRAYRHIDRHLAGAAR